MSTHATIAALATAVLVSLGAIGCEATFTPVEPVFTVSGGGVVAEVTSVPMDIWSYPRVFFGGEWVYLVNGAWYRPTPRGWVIYRREPVELSRARVRIYASPDRSAPRSPAYGYPAPPTEPYERGRERTPR